MYKDVYPLLTIQLGNWQEGWPFMRYINCYVCMACLLIFMRIKFLWILLGFLSMIINEVLYTWCLRHNICSSWFLDISISTCWVMSSCPKCFSAYTVYMLQGNIIYKQSTEYSMTIIIMHIFKHTQTLLQNINSQKIVWKHQKTKVHGRRNWSGLDHGLISFGSSI